MITRAPKASPVRSRICPTRSNGAACDIERVARHHLWSTAQKAAGRTGGPPAQADDLRQWAGILIDALLGFEDDMARCPGSDAGTWRRRMSSCARYHLHPLTGSLPTERWLVHARHRTQIRHPLPVDRRLFQFWVSHLVQAVGALVAQSAAAAEQSARSGENRRVSTHLLNARHDLLHACRHLNRHTA
ncbi:hypothetical protein ACFU3O_14550 [Streptomyces antibioticus]|uniref:hypothetical protein n=1 Tax=Streptomyces antibioticus TaxID=1890 RepID=UPI0036A92C13